MRARSPRLRAQADGILRQGVDAELAWLNDRLLELWQDRGPYPGLAAVLHDLGCRRAMEIHQRALATLAAEGQDIAEIAFAALDGDVHPTLEEFEEDLDEAADEWGYFDDEERRLARLLTRMELSSSQVAGILRARRASSTAQGPGRGRDVDDRRVADGHDGADDHDDRDRADLRRQPAVVGHRVPCGARAPRAARSGRPRSDPGTANARPRATRAPAALIAKAAV